MVKNTDIEIEVRLQIGNTKNLITFLKKKATFQSQNRQVDQYFIPAHRNFLKETPVKEWLRIRDEDEIYTLNYKNWHFEKDGRSYFNDEFETKIDNIKTLRKILKALNFKLVVKVDKTRVTYRYQDWEIALDSVKNLGHFVEIEYKQSLPPKGGKGSEKVNPKLESDKMINFLKNLKVGTIKRNYQGYPFLLLFPKEAVYETIP